MRRKRIKNLIVGGALISAFFITKVSAYNQDYTHPALTDEIINFYNLNFSPKLSSQDKIWIIKGSMDEDQGMRPMNHFYDPVHNIGMAGFSKSKEWAMSSATQSNLALANKSIAESSGLIKSSDDFSYERVMSDYSQGDRQRAMIGFGHLLHLIEDAGVPDHTRNDPHPPIGDFGSPYEHEMAKWNPENLNIVAGLVRERLKPVVLGSLNEYFDNLAKYSNGNFFSKDTISNTEYKFPKLSVVKKIRSGEVDRIFIINKDKNGKEYPIAFIQEKNNLITHSIETPEIGSYILDGYWDRLSKEIVLNGAGALNLLITEAEKAKMEYANRPQEKQSWLARMLGLMGISTSNEVVDSFIDGDSMVTPSPKVTNTIMSPTPLVTKTPDTNVTTPSPSVSPLKTPTPTPKPSITPTPSPKPELSPKQTEKININTASKEQLMMLSGIKDAKSDAIIQYRQTHGSFQKVEDIMNVSGIGQATFDNIRDQITVGDVMLIPTPVVSYGGGGGGSSSPAPTSTPTSTPTPTPTPSPDPIPEKININTGSKEQLMTLNGIGDVKSDAIIEYRQTNGPFARIEDIQNVSGIGPVTFENIKDQITVGDVVLKPSAVTDLVATLNSPLAITWSAPDSGSFNTASLSYDMRYSLVNFTDANAWDTATKVASSSLPSVGKKGALQNASFVIANQYGQTVYFALKTKVIDTPTCDVDNMDKCSDISNIGQVNFPTAISPNSWAMLGKDQHHSSVATNLTGPGIGATISWEFDAGAGNTVGQPVVSADGDIYFGSANGTGKLIKLNKDGVKQWEYATNVSISTPAVLSDETVYFGRIGAGGTLAFTALNPDGSKKWDYDDASTIKAVTVSEKGESYITYSNGTDKLVVLNADGSVKTTVSSTGLSGFAPVVLDNGSMIVTKRVSGNQFLMLIRPMERSCGPKNYLILVLMGAYNPICLTTKQLERHIQPSAMMEVHLLASEYSRFHLMVQC